MFCQVTVTENNESIVHARVGDSELRIDKPLPMPTGCSNAGTNASAAAAAAPAPMPCCSTGGETIDSTGKTATGSSEEAASGQRQ